MNRYDGRGFPHAKPVREEMIEPLQGDNPLHRRTLRLGVYRGRSSK
jgi:hypothetical protein